MLGSAASNAGLMGSRRTATMVILGTSSCNSSRRFAASTLPPKNVTPVRLPSGWLRLPTSPHFYRVIPDHEYDRNGRGCSSGCLQRGSIGDDYGDLSLGQIGGEARQPVWLIVRPTLLDDDISSFDKSFLA